MINILFSFFITCTIIITLTQVIFLCKQMLPKIDDEDIFVAIKQISRYTLTHDVIVNDNEIEFDKYCIFNDNGKIVKKPGYETLLYNIDNLEFYIENNLVYIEILRNDKIYKSIINYKL